VISLIDAALAQPMGGFGSRRYARAEADEKQNGRNAGSEYLLLYSGSRIGQTFFRL
jgi:hypothetical protein